MKSNFRSLFFASTIFAACLSPLTAAAVDAGGRLEIADLQKGSEPVRVPSAKKSAETTAKGQQIVPEYEVILLFDGKASMTPAYLALLDDLALREMERPAEKQVRIFALANAPKSIVDEVIGSSTLHFPVSTDEKKILFETYAAEDVILPVAIISQKGKVLWKGAPTDLDSVLRRMRAGQFDLGVQKKIEGLRKDLQMAIRAALPDVINRSADSILELQPGDMIAVQAKLFVMENSGHAKKAVPFAREIVQKTPDEINLQLLYLDLLVRNNLSQEFQTAFSAAVKQFESSYESLSRLLAFAVDRAPFGFLPPRETARLAERVLERNTSAMPDRQALAYEYLARIRHYLSDIDGAIAMQDAALELRAGTPMETASKTRLEYYKALRKAARP